VPSTRSPTVVYYIAILENPFVVGRLWRQMSKAAANMMSALLAQEVKPKGIAVGIFHPGFNKTGMTAKYKEIWEIEGAVDPAIGAKRIMYETGRLSMATSGKFINCEDGLEIPF
jgi:NAD(P)-dependent dehydrogenase (short-subunit alcohol dehydrogenase family)